MAINPLIALQGQAPDIGAVGNRLLQNVANLQQLQQQQELAPLRKDILTEQLSALTTAREQAEANRPALELSQRDKQRLESITSAARQLKPLLDAGDKEGAKLFAQKRMAELQRAGLDQDETAPLLRALEEDDLDKARTMVDSTLQLSGVVKGQDQRAERLQFGAQETFKDEAGNLFFGTTMRSPEGGTVESVLSPIGGGPSKPVGKVNLVSSLGLTQSEQIEAEAKKATAKEAAKLEAQFKLKPKIAAAVADEVAKAEAKAKAIGDQRSNEIALNLYDTAMSGLTESLGGTLTGPFAGWLPAVTADQQIADGAIAAMAPILKQMFRTSGEGTFTDQDQKLLLQMVPTRKDKPEARLAKIANIDAIVRAKFGISAPPTTEGQGETITLPNGVVVKKVK